MATGPFAVVDEGGRHQGHDEADEGDVDVGLTKRGDGEQGATEVARSRADRRLYVMATSPAAGARGVVPPPR